MGSCRTAAPHAAHPARFSCREASAHRRGSRLTVIAFLVVGTGTGDEEWFESASAADAAVASRLAIPADQLEPLRRRVTVDPLVVRRDGSRWRSRQAWNFRSGSASARVYEMLRIDEALYEH